jgi:hypothetical protein
VLQCKYDRLFFPVGTESLVFPDCPFELRLGDSIIAHGFIALSDTGISIAHQPPALPDSIATDSLRVLILPAAPDLSVGVRLGTDGYIPMPKDASPELLSRAEPADVLHWGSPTGVHGSTAMLSTLQLESDLRTGELDGYLSYTQPSFEPYVATAFVPADGSHRIVASSGVPACWVATLVPDVRSDGRANGIIATSLYYRYDHARLPMMFSGSLMMPVNSFLIDSSSRSRPYPVDPSRGRALLRQAGDPPDEIQLYAAAPELRGVASYFVDVLAQDRRAARVVDAPRTANLRVEFVPVADGQPDFPLRYLLAVLARDTVANSETSEHVRLLDEYLRLAATALSGNARSDYLRRAEQVLMTDLGVFPLFRPSVFLVHNRSLLGGRFTPAGRLRYEDLFIVRMPEVEVER